MQASQQPPVSGLLKGSPKLHPLRAAGGGGGPRLALTSGSSWFRSRSSLPVPCSLSRGGVPPVFDVARAVSSLREPDGGEADRTLLSLAAERVQGALCAFGQDSSSLAAHSEVLSEAHPEVLSEAYREVLSEVHSPVSTALSQVHGHSRTALS